MEVAGSRMELGMQTSGNGNAGDGLQYPCGGPHSVRSFSSSERSASTHDWTRVFTHNPNSEVRSDFSSSDGRDTPSSQDISISMLSEQMGDIPVGILPSIPETPSVIPPYWTFSLLPAGIFSAGSEVHRGRAWKGVVAPWTQEKFSKIKNSMKNLQFFDNFNRKFYHFSKLFKILSNFSRKIGQKCRII